MSRIEAGDRSPTYSIDTEGTHGVRTTDELMALAAASERHRVDEAHAREAHTILRDLLAEHGRGSGTSLLTAAGRVAILVADLTADRDALRARLVAPASREMYAETFTADLDRETP